MKKKVKHINREEITIIFVIIILSALTLLTVITSYITSNKNYRQVTNSKAQEMCTQFNETTGEPYQGPCEPGESLPEPTPAPVIPEEPQPVKSGCDICLDANSGDCDRCISECVGRCSQSSSVSSEQSSSSSTETTETDVTDPCAKLVSPDVRQACRDSGKEPCFRCNGDNSCVASGATDCSTSAPGNCTDDYRDCGKAAPPPPLIPALCGDNLINLTLPGCPPKVTVGCNPPCNPNIQICINDTCQNIPGKIVGVSAYADTYPTITVAPPPGSNPFNSGLGFIAGPIGKAVAQKVLNDVTCAGPGASCGGFFGPTCCSGSCEGEFFFISGTCQGSYVNNEPPTPTPKPVMDRVITGADKKLHGCGIDQNKLPDDHTICGCWNLVGVPVTCKCPNRDVFVKQGDSCDELPPGDKVPLKKCDEVCTANTCTCPSGCTRSGFLVNNKGKCSDPFTVVKPGPTLAPVQPTSPPLPNPIDAIKKQIAAEASKEYSRLGCSQDLLKTSPNPLCFALAPLIYEGTMPSGAELVKNCCSAKLSCCK